MPHGRMKQSKIPTMDKDLYQEIVRTLTDYEHPEDAGLTKEDATEQLYFTLVKVQNALDSGEIRFSEE